MSRGVSQCAAMPNDPCLASLRSTVFTPAPHHKLLNVHTNIFSSYSIIYFH